MITGRKRINRWASTVGERIVNGEICETREESRVFPYFWKESPGEIDTREIDSATAIL